MVTGLSTFKGILPHYSMEFELERAVYDISLNAERFARHTGIAVHRTSREFCPYLFLSFVWENKLGIELYDACVGESIHLTLGSRGDDSLPGT